RLYATFNRTPMRYPMRMEAEEGSYRGFVNIFNAPFVYREPQILRFPSPQRGKRMKALEAFMG
ncbi:MAG: hypothetical protein ACRD2L_21870, partial [Terriglobia bacterium]